MARPAARLLVLLSPERDRIGHAVAVGPSGLVVGRSSSADFVIRDEALSRRHLRVVPIEGGFALFDLGSTHGVFVNCERAAPGVVVAPGDRIQIGQTFLKVLVDEPDVCCPPPEFRPLLDGLTGVANRRCLLDALEERLAAGVPVALVYVDVDRMQVLNYLHGHLEGDRVLKDLARLLPRHLAGTPEALVARYGGEAFAVLLPGAPGAVALDFAETLRASVEAHPFVLGGRVETVTVSIGVASAEPGETARGLVARADEAMLAAKQAGRNRAFLHEKRNEHATRAREAPKGRP